jgi:hypothetical protein
MSHQVCHDVGSWVDDNVSQPVQKCVEQDCNWWCLCCNKWFCFIVWIVVTVVNWVVQTVCEIVADVVDVVVAVVVGLFNIIVGIFTWNWARVWDALVDIVASVVGLVWDVIRTATLGSLIGAFVDGANAWSLRGFVRGLIDGNRAYNDEQRAGIKEALGVDGGGFGFRLQFTAVRGFVRSDQMSEGATPDLVTWNNDPDADTRVDLKILAGFTSTTFWQRGRPDVEPGLSESDIDAYLANPTSVQPFSIFSMSQSVFDDKLSTAVTKASLLGLKLRFNSHDAQLMRQVQVRMAASPAGTASVIQGPPLNRTTGSTSVTSAQNDLCMPAVLGSFLYDDNSFTGFSAHLATSTCLDGTAFESDGMTGVTFRDRLPDFAFRYVPIHEIGHTFGLCHVDGADRIMLSTKDHSFFSWGTIPGYWLHGGPIFTLDEAKRVWEYIIANFSPECLTRRQFN